MLLFLTVSSCQGRSSQAQRKYRLSRQGDHVSRSGSTSECGGNHGHARVHFNMRLAYLINHETASQFRRQADIAPVMNWPQQKSAAVYQARSAAILPKILSSVR